MHAAYRNLPAPEKKYRRTPFEAAIIEGAEAYVAFVSVSRRDQRSVRKTTLLEAREAAKGLARSTNRPAIVFAIKGSSQAYLETVDPKS